MTCPAHRAGLVVTATARTDIPETTRPITDADAREVIARAVTDLSGTTFEIPGRLPSLEVQHHDGLGDGLHVTVWDADEPDDAPGADFLVTVQRLTRCDTHHRHYLAADRMCDLCVHDQVREDR